MASLKKVLPKKMFSSIGLRPQKGSLFYQTREAVSTDLVNSLSFFHKKKDMEKEKKKEDQKKSNYLVIPDYVLKEWELFNFLTGMILWENYYEEYLTTDELIQSYKDYFKEPLDRKDPRTILHIILSCRPGLTYEKEYDIWIPDSDVLKYHLRKVYHDLCQEYGNHFDRPWLDRNNDIYQSISS